MLEIKNLHFKYKKRLILENINFQIHRGEFLSILGLNGSGKTTLLKNIAKILSPTKGTVIVNGKDKLNKRELAKNIGYLPQKYSGELVTVFDTILLGRKAYINFLPSKNDIKLVNKIIENFKLQKISSSNTNQLSGGELQKVLIARAVAQNPKILLLDEPVNHLDIYNQYEVMNIIKKLVKNMKIIVISVLHDINIALKFSDKFLFLKNNKIFAYGNSEIITPDLLKNIYNINVKIVEIEGEKVVCFID